MHARLLGVAVLGLLTLSARADDTQDKDVLKEIDLKGVTLKQVEASFKKPTEITSAEDLAKIIPGKDAREKIEKAVNLTTHKLLFFAWSGSGGDRVLPAVTGDKPQVKFSFQGGRTRDYRAHFRLYSLRKNIPYTVGK